ncbi:hypothetical protein PJ262_03075 [Streptococcus dysgalactiae]|uniref:hypothetical protein n=1 Tax=Streptococcus TaxID=1301 RepID=UPI000976574B|nr:MULTISPECIES: hypothetical protein [Streptococcus]ELY5747652.1 hypothetical protein [Streptococcus iniae]MDT2749364.1 hypothetical protein [Streptococcus parauberis]MSU87446.1 hypothetical protein [Streptococcus dysgalactiae subsp. dysgalactiae]ONH62968.1 hypothetical protein ASN87_01707 [Streptococcus parauberis]PCH14562.1 hypothetical protein A9Y58_00061 [Streptococcus parauberis]
MEMLKTVITALGVAGTVRGLMGVWSGWEEFTIGKETQAPQKQKQGEAGMIYGGMMAAGAVTIATGIITALGGLHF